MLLPVCRFVLAALLLSLNLMVLSSCAMFLCIWYPLGGRVSRWMHAGLDWLQMRHAGNAGWILRHVSGVTFVVDFPETLQQNGSYIVVANHRSHVDIAVLSAVLYKRAPVLKFFLKRSLAYVPFVGWFSAAMGYPFVDQVKSVKQGRAMKAVLEKQRERLADQCEKLFAHPHCLVIFAEGTRFKAGNQSKEGGLQHVLPPQSMGVGIALSRAGQDFFGMIDVTLAYGDALTVSPWLLLSGQCSRITACVRLHKQCCAYVGKDVIQDRALRQSLTKWLAALWVEKDAYLSRVIVG